MQKLPLVALGLIAAVLLFVPPWLKSYGIYLFSYWLVFVIATMGLNLTVGYAGQKSLGHAAFFGIGAYTVAILMKAGFSFWLGLPLAMAGCFVIGLALGFPALRVQTIYLAFATLGFNTAVWLVMRNEEWLTGGTFGINNIARPSLFGFSLDGNLAYYHFVLGTTVLLGALQWGLLRSPWGKAFTALRDNPIRAESLGIHIQAYTLLSFAIGAVYAGIAGALFASLVQFIEPAPFAVSASIMMYLMVVLGGPGYFFGPLLGSAVGVLLPEWLRFAQAWYLFVFGAAVVLLMLWLPDGLLSIPERLRARRLAREASAARAAAAARVRGGAVTQPVLKVSGLAKSYGAIKAVNGVSFEVLPGEIFGVIGPNGSGKTTMFNSVLGQITPDAGRIELNGREITGESPMRLNRLGVGRTFQTLQVFGKMSVRDNLLVAAQEHRGSMFSRMFAPGDSGLGARADALIDQFRIRHVADKKAGELSYGQQKLVDIAMAFMSEPALVLLDEPCAGVNPSLVGGISTLLKELNRIRGPQGGGSFIVIEHNMDFVMDLCHRIMVMVEGEVMAIGTPAEIRANKQVLDAYLGS